MIFICLDLITNSISLSIYITIYQNICINDSVEIVSKNYLQITKETITSNGKKLRA